jgi:hypothetical protein
VKKDRNKTVANISLYALKYKLQFKNIQTYSQDLLIKLHVGFQGNQNDVREIRQEVDNDYKQDSQRGSSEESSHEVTVRSKST